MLAVVLDVWHGLLFFSLRIFEGFEESEVLGSVK